MKAPVRRSVLGSCAKSWRAFRFTYLIAFVLKMWPSYAARNNLSISIIAC